jgi:aquaglyceroporin related protein
MDLTLVTKTVRLSNATHLICLLTYIELEEDPEKVDDLPKRPRPQRSTTGGNLNALKEDSDETLHEGRGHHESRERAPVNEHGLDYNNASGQPQHFGMQDGLPPLQQLDSSKTTQSQKEEKESQQREHDAEQEFYNRYRNPIARLRARYPQAPAEFLATFIYLFLGICVNLSVATSQKSTGSFETQAWGWGFSVMLGIYMGGGVSGAHLSPTISIALSIYRGFPWRMAAVYICMQMLAGLAAGGLAYA